MSHTEYVSIKDSTPVVSSRKTQSHIKNQSGPVYQFAPSSNSRFESEVKKNSSYTSQMYGAVKKNSGSITKSWMQDKTSDQKISQVEGKLSSAQVDSYSEIEDGGI
jgi:hypothetical protein